MFPYPTQEPDPQDIADQEEELNAAFSEIAYEQGGSEAVDDLHLAQALEEPLDEEDE